MALSDVYARRVRRRSADRLAAEGVAFAYLFDRDLPDGRNIIMAVPVK